MSKKPKPLQTIGPNSAKEYAEMELRFAKITAAARAGVSHHNKAKTNQAYLEEQKMIKEEAKKEAQSIGETLRKVLSSLSPRSPRSSRDKEKGGRSMD